MTQPTQEACGLKPALLVEFGARVAGVGRSDDGGLRVALPLPILAGDGREILLDACDAGERPADAGRAGHFDLVRCGGFVAGAAVVPVPGDRLEQASREIYRDLLGIMGESGLQPYRIWNYVPRINAVDSAGMERYRAFNLGRWSALAEGRGDLDRGSLPAASAVGISDPAADDLAVIFVAGREPVRFFENPAQVPAYEYPACYGPRPPSFCRGALVAGQSFRRAYLSGTASIRGHESVGRGELSTQIAVTAENVRAMEAVMGVEGSNAQFKVYVRAADDLDAVREGLARELGTEAAAGAIYLQAGICRGELVLEVEAVYRPDAR